MLYCHRKHNFLQICIILSDQDLVQKLVVKFYHYIEKQVELHKIVTKLSNKISITYKTVLFSNC